MTQSVEPILAAISWNRSRFRGQKPPLKPKQIWGIRARLQICKRFRDLALFELALDSKLRGCDLVRVKVSDVALNGVVRSRATVIQRKTERPVQFELTEQTRTSLHAWIQKRGNRAEEYLFPSRRNHSGHISTRQYARLVDEWIGLIGLDPKACGTHSDTNRLLKKFAGEIRSGRVSEFFNRIRQTETFKLAGGSACFS